MLWELVTLYREHREIQTACPKLKSALLGGRVLCARTSAGPDQDVCALLVTLPGPGHRDGRRPPALAAGTGPGLGPASPSP
jgi:hypothetical protein